MKRIALIMSAALLTAQTVLAAAPTFEDRFAVDLKDLHGSLKTEAARMQKVAAAPVTYSGRSRWTHNQYHAFSALEQLGVKKSAEEGAVMQCQRAGRLNCAAINSEIRSCNGWACEGAALARSLGGGPRTPVQGHSRWTRNRFDHFGALEQLGVRKAAEDHAVLACQRAGYSDCAAISSSIDLCNGWACEASAIASGNRAP